MSLNISDCWNQVDGSSCDEHGWLSGENLGSSGIDLLRCYLVNSVTVLVEGEVSEGHEVAGNLFESLVLSLHGHEHVHLEDVLGASKLLIWNWLLKSVQLLKHDAH